MRIEVLDGTEAPKVDWLGGASGPFSSRIPSLDSFLVDSNSDVLLAPHDLFDVKSNRDYLGYLRRNANRKFLIVSNRGDYPLHICHPRIISIQSSIEPGKLCLKHKTVVIPYNVETPSETSIRDFQKIPTISFVGYLPPISIGRVFRTLTMLPFHPIKGNGAIVRRLGARALRNTSRHIFHPHNEYSATHKVARDFPERRRRYLTSMQESDLIFSPRGDANLSQRFYEALAMGRIPVVPDTGVTFPKKLQENLGEYVIQVRPTSIDLQQRIYSFWSILNPEKYEDLQMRIRSKFEADLKYPVFLEKMFSSSLQALMANY